jgi:hypothetical protein
LSVMSSIVICPLTSVEREEEAEEASSKEEPSSVEAALSRTSIEMEFQLSQIYFFSPGKRTEKESANKCSKTMMVCTSLK